MAAKKKFKVLSCACGDCLHWEVVKTQKGTVLKCKTCNDTFPVTIEVPEQDKLEWVERDNI